MGDNQEATAGGGPTDNQQTHAATGAAKSFPTNAVVGIIDEPDEVLRAANELRSAGFEPDVFCSEHGMERIKNAGGSPEQVRVIRTAQNLFGYEADHTERHLEELTAGHFILLVKSHDNKTTEQIHDVFSEHGGHFVNYYSTWTSRTLIG